MGILDWFKNRPSASDHDHLTDELVRRGVEKAITLANPKLKLVDSCETRLSPAVRHAVGYLRDMAQGVPAAIRASAACWAFDPVLRAFFASPSDIPTLFGHSRNLRTLFDKFPSLDEAFFILDMTFAERRMFGVSLQGDMVRRDVALKVLDFSEHQVRICGHEESEVRRLLGVQAFEYLVAQAMYEISEGRSERRELEGNRMLIRSRLRLLRQQGPGLGSVFGKGPSGEVERAQLEAELLENERQLQLLGSPQSSLGTELDHLCAVLRHPERYIGVSSNRRRLSTMNVVLGDESTDVASEIVFSVASLSGLPRMSKAFVLAHCARSELPEARMNFDDAERFL